MALKKPKEKKKREELVQTLRAQAALAGQGSVLSTYVVAS